ncbi:NAD(P)-dependent dehydrogenase (short-subunit alcohol dehydrogenase family) [Polymorphobacter multimanifer]|uniref:NAD(P)-dependent dehydrogenase (Short-subunit alcohol dehydrogenase family) n=1 Tax=Polymorphobacter multimanifer TaxID=1070431 RepID=A0A841LB83_9SPHN|nr:SDR family oxidoreductase [Polymorphobacter multimanifer]MBB6228921.1 NAD(P)-dependent dehydrogenase (short-subunit alcohol dehydrogenase family) [Polymorphobacter multimanifer]
MFADGLMRGQKILVTGGGTGLGKSMAGAFARLGAEVVIWGRRGGVLDDTAAELAEASGSTVTAMPVDIRNGGAIDEAMQAIFDAGPLTGLVNNAAGNFISPTEDLSPNAFNAIASIVAAGTFNTTVAAGKRWIEAGLPGNILSIVTTWVWTGGPFTVPSAMSKAGVAAMTQSLAQEWGPKRIRANAIAPGPFPTKGAWERLMPAPLMEKTGAGTGAAGIPMGRMGEHEELDNLAVFLMAPGCAYLTGEVIALDGGQWLASNGNFHSLSALDRSDWDMIKGAIQATNAKDRQDRTA